VSNELLGKPATFVKVGTALLEETSVWNKTEGARAWCKRHDHC